MSILDFNATAWGIPTGGYPDALAKVVRDYQAIPDAAVEAAARAHFERSTGLSWEDETEQTRRGHLGDMRDALDAAKPRMIEHFANRVDWRCLECEDPIESEQAIHQMRLESAITTITKLDVLPEGSIVRTESGQLFVKEQIRVGHTSWWVTTNEQRDFKSADIPLPATPMHKGYTG